MCSKELLLQEMEQVSESVLSEVLDFLRFLKAKEEQEQLENEIDIAEAHQILAEINEQGTVPWEALKMAVEQSKPTHPQSNQNQSS